MSDTASPVSTASDSFDRTENPSAATSDTAVEAATDAPEWDEKTFARLVGFDDDDLDDNDFEDGAVADEAIAPSLADSDITDTVPDASTEAVPEDRPADDDGNVLSEAELFDKIGRAHV